MQGSADPHLSKRLTHKMAEAASPTSHSGTKLQLYTVDFKVQAVETLRNDPNFNISAVARRFSTDRKRLREWDKNYDKLLAAHFGNDKKRRNGQLGKRVCVGGYGLSYYFPSTLLLLCHFKL